MKNQPFEINSYGTQIFNIKTLIPEGLDIEIIINEIKAGTRDFIGCPVRFTHYEIESKETYQNGIVLDIPYSTVEIGERIDGEWYVCHGRITSTNVKTKEEAIDLAKTIIYIETYCKKNDIRFALSQFRNKE